MQYFDALNPKNISVTTLKVIFTLSAANAIFLSIAYALDIGNNSYIFVGDRFGDFLKVVLSYPGSSEINLSKKFGLFGLISDYINNNPYKGIDGLNAGGLTHFHMPPLTTAVSLINLSLMGHITPQLDFYLMVCLVFLSVVGVASASGVGAKEKLIWAACIFMSYPFLFILQRGNLFSAATTILIIFYLLLIYRKSHINIALILLALAVNIRPNALVFILFLAVLQDKSMPKRLILFLTAVTAIFFVSLEFVGWLYPDYSIDAFLRGLKIYHTLYVVGDGGFGYSSSLYTFMKYFFGYNISYEIFGFVFPIIFLIIALAQFINHRIDLISYLFVICGTYMLSSSVFADYHLLVFIAPVIFQGLQNTNLPHLEYQPKLVSLTIFGVCCFLLSPKNYIFTEGISLLVLLNPIIMLSSIILILYRSFTNNADCIVSK